MKSFKTSGLLLSLLAIFAVAPMFGAADGLYEEHKKLAEDITKGIRTIYYVLKLGHSSY